MRTTIVVIATIAILLAAVAWERARARTVDEPCRQVAIRGAVVFDGTTPVAGVTPERGVYDFHNVCLVAQSIVIDKAATIYVGKRGKLYAASSLLFDGYATEEHDGGGGR